MFAASGVLGLLLMGAAVGGLMAGTESLPHSDDDDETGSNGSRGDASGHDEAFEDQSWTGDFVADGSFEGGPSEGPGDAPLAKLLFAEPEENGRELLDDALGHQDTVEDVLARPDVGIEDRDTVEITDVIPFPGGPDIPCVAEFECGTDRLILDFDGTEDEAPLITIDLDLLPGSAVIEANGIPVTLVEGAGDLHPDDVDVVMSGVPLNASDTDPSDSSAGDANMESSQTETAFIDAVTNWETDIAITDFDPAEDLVEVLYDPSIFGNPEVEVVDFEDGTGASIILDGTPIMHLEGAQGLDPSRIILRASDALPEASAETS